MEDLHQNLQYVEACKATASQKPPSTIHSSPPPPPPPPPHIWILQHQQPTLHWRTWCPLQPPFPSRLAPSNPPTRFPYLTSWWSRLLGLIYNQCLFWPPPTSTFSIAFRRSSRLRFVHVLSSLLQFRELFTGRWVPFEVVNLLALGKLITVMSLEFLDGKYFKFLFSINFLLILYRLFYKLIDYYNIGFSYSTRKVVNNISIKIKLKSKKRL